VCGAVGAGSAAGIFGMRSKPGRSVVQQLGPTIPHYG